MTIQEKYIDLKKEYDAGKLIAFITELTNDNSPEMLDFHYSLLTDQSNKNIFDSVRNSFKKRKTVAIDFLKSKIKTEKNEDLKSESLFILGLMRYSGAKKDVINLFKTTTNTNIKYKCIVILGWLGESTEDIIFLSDIMENINENIELRAYAVSAMRQIWFRDKSFGTYIVEKYQRVLICENEYILDSTILACAQDILKKKWGITESRIGEISGDIIPAKTKALKVINKYLEKKII